jgi:hypothetical protein
MGLSIKNDKSHVAKSVSFMQFVNQNQGEIMDEIKALFKSRFGRIVIGILFAWAVASTILWNFYYRDYTRLQAAIDTANAGEFQRKLGNVTAELERTRAALAESEQSVERLAGVDSRRLAGIERIERSLDATGRAISNAQSGNARAEAAFRGIEELSYILETEFSRSPK